MKDHCKIGDLVHIPQSVVLTDCGPPTGAQLNIPLKVLETKEPRLGIVITDSERGYVRIHCDGDNWTVKNDRIYKLSGEST